MYRSLFSPDLFAEMDRLQREMQQAFDVIPSIRGFGRGGFPALNVGGTPASSEIYAFAPGLDPKTIELQLDRGILSISGTRDVPPAESGGKPMMRHLHERFAGSFRRVVSLPDDADPEGVSADYRDGVLHVTVKRRAEAQPRRITVQ